MAIQSEKIYIFSPTKVREDRSSLARGGSVARPDSCLSHSLSHAIFALNIFALFLL